MQLAPQRLGRDRPAMLSPMLGILEPRLVEQVVHTPAIRRSLIFCDAGSAAQALTCGTSVRPCEGRCAGPGFSMSLSKAGPASDQPISSRGPTASNAARPQWPASSGSITFNANVAALAPSNILRAGRNTSDCAPASDKWRVAIRRPTTVRSTAGATKGATYAGTPNLRAKLSTFPKPNKKVRPTTTIISTDTNRSTRRRSPIIGLPASTDAPSPTAHQPESTAHQAQQLV